MSATTSANGWPATDGLGVELTDGVLTITLDRPDRANSLRGQEMDALAAIFARVNGEDLGSVRAVLMQGSGRHFCAGAEIGTDRREKSPDGTRERPAIGHMMRGLRRGAHGLVQAMWDCPLPLIAAVQGRAAGLGCHLVAATDFAVAARGASFVSPFVSRGFSADSGGTFLLPQRVGLSRAKEMLLRGTVIDAPTALEWGLICSMVDDEELGAASRALAAELASGATFAYGLTKQLVHRHATADLAQALEDEAIAIEMTIRSDDFKEGMRAFVEKRAPEFRGR